MAWQKQHQETVDLRTKMHVMTLHEPETGAVHKLQIMIGHDSCPHCGHITLKDEVGDTDVAQHVANELESLTQSHAAMMALAKRRKALIRKASK